MARRPVPLLLLAALALAGCAGSGSGGGASAGGGALEVSVGFYPYEFVARRVGGPDVRVTNLTQPGGEPHDLELTPSQVAGLSRARLVVYSKGFQPAVDEAVEQQAGDRALDVLTTVDLMRADPSADREAGGADPHVWLDPVHLATIAVAVAERLAALAPDRAGAFRDRSATLQVELTALDGELRAGLTSCQRRQIVTSHDAFGYLAGAYSLQQVAIAGLSPEEEASPGRLAEIAVEAKGSGVTTIFFEELVSPKVARSLAREVGAEAVVLSPVEGPPESGDYFSAMRDNLRTLRTALGCT